MEKKNIDTFRKPNGSFDSSTSDEVWQTKGTLKSRLFHALGNEIMCDLHFFVGRGRDIKDIIPAHKLILSVSSPYFNNIFKEMWLVKDDITGKAQFLITDVEPPIFRALLKYVYTEELDKDYDTVISMLYPAKKYKFKDLERACENFLVEKVFWDTACDILPIAKNFGLSILMEKCFVTFDAHAESFRHEKFADLDLDLVSAIFKRDTLIVDEKHLFDAAMSWSMAECKRRDLPIQPKTRRKLLKNAFSYIRYPLMSLADFTNGPVKSNMLHYKECVDLFTYFVADHKPVIKFYDTNLRPIHTLGRFSRVEAIEGYQIDHDLYRYREKVSFSVDRPIVVKSFGVYGSTDSSQLTCAGNLDIRSGRVFRFKSFKFTSVNSTEDTRPFVYPVVFDPPIEIEPHVSYTVTIMVTGPRRYGGIDGKDKITVVSPRGDVTFSFMSPECCSSSCKNVICEENVGYQHGFIDVNPHPIEKGTLDQILFCVVPTRT